MTLLRNQDPLIAAALTRELDRQQHQIELIASENIVSPAVLEAQGSILTNKYAEGYSGRRYYGGCEHVDVVEDLAVERVKALFGCQYANVQPHSGAQANQSVFLALLSPGDTVMGLSLDAGGHLTHGSSVSMSGKWFRAVSYPLNPVTHLIDYEELEILAYEHRPKLIIAGGSAYPRDIDFARFRKIADAVGAFLMVDMAHVAGLVAGGVYPTPFPHAHVVTSTTHKTLRGPRGGIILTNDETIAKKINAAVFPGIQGGPLMHVIAAKAVAFGEALLPSFKEYARQVVVNAQTMASCLKNAGFSLVSDGTDSHLILVDLRPQELTGRDACDALESVHITCNKNGIPFDKTSPLITSGIRLGTPAITTRGFKEEQIIQTTGYIITALEAFVDGNRGAMDRVKKDVLALCEAFPIYPGLSYT